jgi:hypothetical protein
VPLDFEDVGAAIALAEEPLSDWSWREPANRGVATTNIPSWRSYSNTAEGIGERANEQDSYTNAASQVKNSAVRHSQNPASDASGVASLSPRWTTKRSTVVSS